MKKTTKAQRFAELKKQAPGASCAKEAIKGIINETDAKLIGGTELGES